MRQLRYSLELPDGSHQEHAAIAFAEAETLLMGMDWKAVKDVALDFTPVEKVDNPFLLFLDEGESFFMILPESNGYQVTIRVMDKWNLFGFMPKQKSFTLEFGIMSLEDALVLLKLFFQDNYPALRAIEKDKGWRA